MRIAMVAGEMSGDILGAGLIRALQVHYPDAQFEGIGGEQMISAGLHSYFPLETLSVMGLVEVLKHYRSIKRCYNQLRETWLNNPPDVFIGIDAPDFNLRLEYDLKQARIPTVHYVSPTVWAWRRYRVKKVIKSCDLVLSIFPFEVDFYRPYPVNVQFVGHPLADEMPLKVNQQAAREWLKLPKASAYIALLPGSRQGEVQKLGTIFLQTAQWLQQYYPDLHFILPIANAHLQQLVMTQITQTAPHLSITLIDGNAREAMAAADVVLTASGTATLETLLSKRPMVVAYKVAFLTYFLFKPLVKVPYFAMANLLADEALAPEFLQYAVTPANLGQAVSGWLEHPAEVYALQQRYTQIHQQLRCNASEQAAQAIVNLLCNLYVNET
ncbi:lipid-A-disaccharide synthase [Beggiatoa leptomitoformis]|uniref:Lipid-A-disaccharide synthase n=1 Tax=Beggiatoa leptomitoformis TaxID=288004 RepID=A0A2N9YBV2_9GAMM|nr:lipid-A-disaccharide synthase [Beggiatoa leptomitoformis]ALG66780.1 lipid-A-disaccharide synthase [Beggiatoa leptomitoformis]AUI67874.1 lipid-A-disaccharide synthase [Beggiatoa leptomitoformis]